LGPFHGMARLLMAQDRITNERLGQAITFYLNACKNAGMKGEQLEGACVTAPYGNNFYFVRFIETPKREWLHDLPGFRGSGGMGYRTKREAYERILQSANAINELNALMNA